MPRRTAPIIGTPTCTMLGLAGLQRIQRVDAGRVGPRNGDIEAVLLEEAALERDRQRQHVDAGDHADLQLHGRGCAAAAATGSQQRAQQHQQTFASLILPVAAARRASPNTAGQRR